MIIPYDETNIYQLLDEYEIDIDGEIINVKVAIDNEGFSHYYAKVTNITKSTEIILEKIREEFINKIYLKTDVFSEDNMEMREKFEQELYILVKKYFPGSNEKTVKLLIGLLIRQNIGLGEIEILLHDSHLEELVVNGSKENIRIYHKKHGWLETNINLETEDKIRHYATMIASENNKEITILTPILDAHLTTGDRINATLQPISSNGHTMTIRKFSDKPWTIADFLRAKTISLVGAATIWLGLEYELSVLIVGGTGSGKTSMLNVMCSFIPFNQRIISIEDTREIQLSKDAHWVPMETRNSNLEGKGKVDMLDLLVNSLRQRPDRIILGEVRKKAEAEVMFEAMHTGHSVYGTFHANNVEEAVRRLTTQPISLPQLTLPALGLMVVQNRNRRTSSRKTFQIAELLDTGEPNVLMQYSVERDKLEYKNQSVTYVKTLNMFGGLSEKEINEEINQKTKILKMMVSKGVNDVDEVGKIFRNYYLKKWKILK